jgi:hypothetical protein
MRGDLRSGLGGVVQAPWVGSRGDLSVGPRRGAALSSRGLRMGDGGLRPPRPKSRAERFLDRAPDA